MKKSFIETERIRHEEINPFLYSSVEKINQSVINYGETHTEVKGLGTTLNFLMFVSDKLYIAHVGDSRTYMFYKNHMWQLTIDHNVETFTERGWINKASISADTKKEALVRSIGMTNNVEMDVYDLKVQPGTIFVTCSDGLYGMVRNSLIAKTIYKNIDNFRVLPNLLIAEALKGGGKDNVTVVVSKVCE
jgi:protein phosphatase